MRSYFTAMTALAFVLTSHIATAQPVEKEELGGLIKEYLRENPEVIIDSVELYQKKMQAESMEKSKTAISSQMKAIYDNPNHARIGKKDAPVTIVEFFDYNCSACKYMFSPLDKLEKAGLKDVQVIFVEYPIFGEKSENLSKIALAVHTLEPNKYYEFHGKMMTHKGNVSPDQAYGFAKEIGVDREKIEKELTQPRYNEILKENAALGDTLQIRGTPFMIIGGEPVPHALDDKALAEYITNAKATKK
jgi:protein-disulfide isomerase